MTSRYCSNCGHELGEEGRFCPECGRPTHETAHVPTPEADVPVPPPPSQQQAGGTQSFGPTAAAPRQRSLAGRLFVGCTGLIVLAVLFVGCLALIPGGGEQQPTDSGSEEAAKTQPGATKQNAVSIGETVKAGPVEWNVIRASQETELKSSFAGRKQGNFVIVDFNFTNGKDEAATLDSESFRLIDSQGREFEVDTDTYEYVPMGKDIFLEQVNPGVSKEGRVIFTVAPDASGFTLQAGDTDMFVDKNAYIDLGF